MKTRNECREWREQLGAYVLDQLGEGERVALEAHLEGCAACRAEAAALEHVALMLPHADPVLFKEPAPQPPPELGRRVAATIAAERGGAQQRQRRRRLFGGFALGGTAAALAAVVLALFVVGGGSGEPVQHVKFTVVPKGVSVYATLEPHAYGTEIHMYVRGVRSGTLCRVSLRGPGGVSYDAGTFRYRWGDDADAVLSSALDVSQTRAIVVRAGKQTFVGPVGSEPTAANPNEEEPT
jgi:Putative zinc-finger